MEDEETLLYGDEDGGGNEAAMSGDVARDDEEESMDPPAVNDHSSKPAEEDFNAPSQIKDESSLPAPGEGAEGDGNEGEEDEEDSDDDEVRITIDQDKIDEAKTSYQTLRINKSARQLPGEKKGKFGVEEFDQVGTIDGTPAHEVDLEAIEDKPWRKPGADITDYLNYGFTEETWNAYCSRQRRMRVNESGVGMPGNPSTSTSYGSSYSAKPHNGGTIPTLGNQMPKRHPIIVSGTPSSMGAPGESLPDVSAPPPPGNIAVMTSDKREYSKKIFDTIDFSVPPPGMNIPPPNVPPPNFAAPPPAEEFDSHEDNFDFYGGGYEPTQESQWVAPPSAYVGGGPPPNSDAPPGDAAYDDKRDVWERNGSAPIRSSRESPSHRHNERKRRRSRSRSRERSSHHYREREHRERGERRDRDRERDRDRDRERRRGSRTRSPRESRSPSGSNHKHKKSKKDRKEREIKKEIKREPEDHVE